MENQLKIIKSEKGKDLVLVNTCKYRHIRQRNDGKVKWRCIHKTCNASILTDSRHSILLEILGEHNHILDTVEKIQRQILRENCKRKANDTISVKPSKIIRTELLKADFEVPYSYIKSIRKTLNDLLRKEYSIFPQSLNSTIIQLKEMQNKDRFKFKNEHFIHVPENQNFICITTRKNINLLTQCDDIFIDGTFEYVPKYFLQLYTIHGLKNGFYIPLVYFFLPYKCEETYIQMWTFLKNICFEYLSTRLYIHTLHVDFDKAAHEAAKTMFPGITIIGSRFHLGQAWWRKIQEHNILRTSYLTDGNELGIWLKSFFGLPFLPLEKVEEGFLELMSMCPNESEGCIFSDYILESYIESGCPFPPELWASEPSISPRTTNEIESFHKMYNNQFHSAHPPTHVVISILMEIQAGTMITINSISRNLHKEMRSSDLLRIQNVIQHFNNYKIHKNIIKYLTSIGSMYQEKKLY